MVKILFSVVKIQQETLSGNEVPLVRLLSYITKTVSEGELLDEFEKAAQVNLNHLTPEQAQDLWEELLRQGMFAQRIDSNSYTIYTAFSAEEPHQLNWSDQQGLPLLLQKGELIRSLMGKSNTEHIPRYVFSAKTAPERLSEAMFLASSIGVDLNYLKVKVEPNSEKVVKIRSSLKRYGIKIHVSYDIEQVEVLIDNVPLLTTGFNQVNIKFIQERIEDHMQKYTSVAQMMDSWH